MRLPFSRQREKARDPYWDAFINAPPADPNNVIPHAFSHVHDGETNPVRTEVHSPNVQSGHIKELGLTPQAVIGDFAEVMTDGNSTLFRTSDGKVYWAGAPTTAEDILCCQAAAGA